MQPESENWRMIDDRRYSQQIRELLRRAGFCPKRDELTVGRTGRRVIVAFQTGEWVPNFEEILREPDVDWADFADV